MFWDQSPFAIRFDWGERGLEAIGPGSALIVVVDVLSFCTCVDVACARGAAILPYAWKDDTAARFAQQRGAILADGSRRSDGYSLSPASLHGVPAGARLVLPSPNGAAMSLRAARIGPTVAACLRNAAAVARYACAQKGPIAVVACGERWADGTLRPAWEDCVGAGAVIANLARERSPEAEAARATFRQAEAELRGGLIRCSSGQELIERGFVADVELAAAYGVSRCVPVLADGAFVDQGVCPAEEPWDVLG